MQQNKKHYPNWLEQWKEIEEQEKQIAREMVETVKIARNIGKFIDDLEKKRIKIKGLEPIRTTTENKPN